MGRRIPDIKLLIAFCTLIFLSSCETDVELLAPYEQTPVIYGVLDFTADTQFVRINKTFLGEGNPNQYSGIKDSVEYDPADVRALILKYDDNQNLLDSFLLVPVDIARRAPGIFYEEDVRFYHTTELLLTESEASDPEEFIFELNATIKGKTYTAETRFPGLSSTTIQAPFDPGTGDPQRIRFTLSNPERTFISFPFIYQTDAFSAAYSASFRMYFDYVLTDGTVKNDEFIDFELGDYDNSELRPLQEIQSSVFGEDWFAFIGNQLDLIPDLSEVKIEILEMRVSGATPELNTYLEVTQPVSQFTPVLSSFSNISNGAIGIFTSVATQTRPAYLNDFTLEKLNSSPLTNSYDYCVQGWSGSNYVCFE